jgi:hypothetical protein
MAGGSAVMVSRVLFAEAKAALRAARARCFHPPTSKAPGRPDFHRGLDFARRFARKGREIARVYAGWDGLKVVLLGTSPLAEADSGPFMTRGPGPPGSSMATPVTPGFAKLAQGVVGVRTPVALGWHSQCTPRYDSEGTRYGTEVRSRGGARHQGSPCQSDRGGDDCSQGISDDAAG